MSIKCACIDDTFRPNEIPLSRWVVKGQQYHINHVFYHVHQGIQGVELVEHDISDCFPYTSYRLTRFGFDKENLVKLLEMIKDCSELNDIEVKDLIKDLVEM